MESLDKYTLIEDRFNCMKFVVKACIFIVPFMIFSPSVNAHKEWPVNL